MPTFDSSAQTTMPGHRLVALQLDRDRRADGVVRIDMGHQAAGRDVADEAELAAVRADQRADAQDGEVPRLAPPLGRLRRVGGEKEKTVSSWHSFDSIVPPGHRSPATTPHLVRREKA